MPIRIIYIILGSLSLIIGIIGLFLPVLPTTPFLLLTSGLYLRSSDKLYKKLISNQFIGNYIKDFEDKKGMTLKAKIFAISLMWIMLTISHFYLSNAGKFLLLTLGIIGTIVMGFVIKTVK